MTHKPRRIVFLGTHGQYNIGDELLLETFLTQLGPQNTYVVNSYDPPFTTDQLADRFTVEVIDTAGDRPRLLRELLRCDLLVFGGGSIIKELYASTGRNRYSTLLMILAIVTFTRWIARKPIAMLNVGVGPVTTPRGLRIARSILRKVDLLTVRDAKSLATCAAVGVTAVQATDAVFSADATWLLGPDSKVANQPAASPSGVTRVALNLNFDIENPDNWEVFMQQLASSLVLANERSPIEIHALPMQAGFKQHDDAEILDAFAKRIPGIAFVRHELRTHSDAARLIASCDVLISERLHAIVMASILGVPSFVLAYDVKVRQLATMLGLDEWEVDINHPFDEKHVGTRVADLVAQRRVIGLAVQQRSTELGAEARRNFDAAREWVATAR